ncbi:MAG: DNA recombination protein RmuC [Burkholderiales bacterium]|nr:DNA recombination protein RmuC [Burkholderiales bacterium]
MLEVALAAALLAAALALWLAWRAGRARTALEKSLEEKHRQMLADLHAGLERQADRMGARLGEELERTRAALHRLELSVGKSLGETAEKLNARIEARLEQISGRVGERLEEGFRRTNETFVSVRERLAAIDEAQKKIETLAGSVVSLQELLGDKRARGAFGEVQLEALVRNVLPPQAFEMQATLSNGARADCVLRLPPPTGLVAVDAKFPLENYHRMFDPEADDASRAAAQRQFRADVKKHVEDIARKYIVPGETAEGAVMFVPAEAVFAEIHAYHPEVVEYAIARRVWIVSPTTLMAVLNTARAVLKDVETRRQVHAIREALARLGQDFRRFEERMRKLADHIRLAHQDAEDVQTSSRRIAQQFQKIEAAQLEGDAPAANVVRLPEERRPGG